MKRVSALMLCVLCALSLSGCWDKREIEDNTFVVLLGIDKAENRGVVITIAFPLSQAGGGGPDEGMDNGGGSYSVMSVKAANVAEGFNLFGAKLSGPLALFMVKTIVISREIAEGGALRDVFASLRFEEIRNTANVMVSECSAHDFIAARVKNPLIDPLRQEELLLEQINGSALYRPIQLLELLAGLKSNSIDGVAMYGGIAAKSGGGSDDEPQQGADRVGLIQDGYAPSQIPIAAENESQIAGLAVFHGGRMVGALDSSEAQTYSLLASSSASAVLSLPDPLDPQSEIAVSIAPAAKTRISGSIRGGAAVFQIDVKLACAVEYMQSGIDYSLPENLRVLKQTMTDRCLHDMSALITKIQKEYNADVLGLGNKLARRFSSVPEWDSYHWPERYRDAVIDLQVEVNIEQIGMTLP